MTKTKTTRAAEVKKTASRVAPAKKKGIRRVIFKADEWYAGAAMSIGIAKRSKAARQPFMPPAQDEAD
jgi:hypothetical protein